MKDFGVVMQEALQTRGEADIELARALAQMGTSAVGKAAELARGAVDLLLDTPAEPAAPAQDTTLGAVAGAVATTAVEVAEVKEAASASATVSWCCC